MAFAQASRRPIVGAVATLGVSDRVSFLRRTYAHLGGALAAFALVTAGMMKFATDLSLRLSFAGSGSVLGMLFVLIAFIAIAYGAQRLALSETSRALQYVGLGLAVLLWSVLAQPVIWMVIARFGNPAEVLAGNTLHAVLSPKATLILGEATVITLAIFIGLTATVFISRKDFTFLRGILSMAMFGVLGLVIAALIFGFSIALAYPIAVALIMCGYILYETSLIANYVRPTQHVAAALMLFTTVVMLFMQVLRLLAEANRR
jgi:FtsH-binding integral membrane protein